MIRRFQKLILVAGLLAWPGLAVADQVAIQLPGREALNVIEQPINPGGGKVSAAELQEFEAGIDAYRAGSFARAREKWSSLSEKGHAPSMHNQAVLLWRGQGGVQDREAAVTLFRQSAVLENPESLHALATMRLKGIAMPQDVDAALEYLDQASMLGYGPSMYNLALIYWHGELVELDKARALELLEAAAEGNYVRAQYDLAGIFYKGSGGVKDLEAAREWFGQAAEQGDPFAQYNLALMALSGEGGPVDKDLAFEQLSRSAEAGTVPAQMRLAAMLATDEHGGGADVPAALAWYVIAAAFGVDDALPNIKMIEKVLDQDQIAEARQRAANFKPSQVQIR